MAGDWKGKGKGKGSVGLPRTGLASGRKESKGGVKGKERGV